MELKEFMADLKEAKHQRINIYFLNSQKLIKGILKNIDGDLEREENKFLDISIKELESDEQVLESFKCKNKGNKKGANNKDRVIVKLRDLEDVTSIEKTVNVDSVMYKLNLDWEDIGVVISPK